MGASDTKNHDVATADPSQFEILVSEISASFLRMLPQNVDKEIDLALRKILEFFDANVCALWLLDPEANAAVRSRFQATDFVPAMPEKFNYGSIVPWLTARACRGEVTLLNRLDELPEEAALDRRSCEALGVRAFLILPVQIERTFRYALQLVYTGEGPEWLAEFVPRLRVLSEVLVSAFERSRSVAALQQAEARLDLAASLAGAGLWDLDMETNMHWASARTRELYGLGPDEPVSLERFFALVHPDDVPGLKKALSAALEGGKAIRTEYRIVLPGGAVRWLAVQGARSPESFAGGNHLLGVSVDITERKKLEETAKRSLEEIKRLNELLQDETHYLRHEINLNLSHAEIVGKSDGIKGVLQKVEQVAPTGSTVLIMGETGTGKELVAQLIHHCLSRITDKFLRRFARSRQEDGQNLKKGVLG